MPLYRKAALNMRVVIFFIAFGVISILCGQESVKYKHILITNDDGIEDSDRLLALARSVKKVSERVSIVVAATDRSGTSNHTTFGKRRSVLEVECRYVEEESNIAIYTLNADPADCILVGLGGLFGDSRPDLVLSGINGGSNIGPQWFRSGTIGAVRTAASMGVRGLALSGFDDDYEQSYTAIPDWITAFISSDIMNALDRNDFLTIGFPKSDPSTFRGIKILKRKITFDYPEHVTFKKILGDDPYSEESKSAWALDLSGPLINEDEKDDRYYLSQGYIIITPMSIDENHPELMKIFERDQSKIPEFK